MARSDLSPVRLPSPTAFLVASPHSSSLHRDREWHAIEQRSGVDLLVDRPFGDRTRAHIPRRDETLLAGGVAL